MRETTAHGLTMRWLLVKTARGTYSLHGYVGNEQLMSHGFDRDKPSMKRCERVVRLQLADIARMPISPCCNKHMIDNTAFYRCPCGKSWQPRMLSVPTMWDEVDLTKAIPLNQADGLIVQNSF